MAFLELENKVAIVTGTNREIGAAMVEALAGAGAFILAAHYGEAKRVESLIKKVRATGGQIESFETDLTNVNANYELVSRAVKLWGQLDILAANAGITINAPFLETNETMWDNLLALNLKGSYFGAQAAARQMIAQGKGGRIIFSTSVTGVQAVQNFSAYGITKAGLIHMAKTLGIELGNYGITVNALGIGATLNERNLQDNPDYEAHWEGVIPTGRVGQPIDLAKALLFLVSEGAQMVNGHTLMIDGGWSATSKLP
ncbi:SDR family oxidoreductase [Candidatus Chlorohelix sp.]|uniref:SDR family NAD(P)-dependent oxidoreductase n=1 Tax=Candidatus Chlorohelix sp. TaxID=3139201 RepID=UPI0030521C15